MGGAARVQAQRARGSKARAEGWGAPSKTNCPRNVHDWERAPLPERATAATRRHKEAIDAGLRRGLVRGHRPGLAFNGVTLPKLTRERESTVKEEYAPACESCALISRRAAFARVETAYRRRGACEVERGA
jgi:hypothetical protein